MVIFASCGFLANAGHAGRPRSLVGQVEDKPRQTYPLVVTSQTLACVGASQYGKLEKSQPHQRSDVGFPVAQCNGVDTPGVGDTPRPVVSLLPPNLHFLEPSLLVVLMKDSVQLRSPGSAFAAG